MPVKRKDTRRRKAKRGGTRKMVGGASPVEILAGILDGLAQIASNPAYSVDSRNRVTALIGLIIISIFKSDDSENMIGGGGMGGKNKGSNGAGDEEEEGRALALPANMNAATRAIVEARRIAAEERRHAANTGARATARGELYRTGAIGVLMALGGAVVGVLGFVMAPAGAPAPTVAAPMGSALVLSNGAVGFPEEMPAAAAAAAPAPGGGLGIRGILMGTGLATALTGLGIAVPALRSALGASVRETRIAVVGGAAANARIEAAEAAGAAFVGAARAAALADTAGHIVGGFADVGVAALGQGGTVPALLGMAGTGLRALGNVGAAGATAAGTGLRALGNVGAAGLAAAGATGAAAFRRPNVRTTTTTTTNTYEQTLQIGQAFIAGNAGAPHLTGHAGGIAGAVTGAAAAAAGGGGGGRRRAGSIDAPLLLGAPAPAPAPATSGFPALMNKN